MIPYWQKLKDPRWQRKRLEILQRDEFACQHCGEKEKELHVHHCVYFQKQEPWDYESSTLITLCTGCHEDVETLKKTIGLHLKYATIRSLYSTIADLVSSGVDAEVNDVLCKLQRDLFYGEDSK